MMVDASVLQSTLIVAFGIPLILIAFILAMPYLAGISLVTPTDSANLTSLGTSTSEMLPWFGILAVTGIILFAVRGK